MSIGELSMVVNDNFDVPLNQQIRNNRFLPFKIVTETTDFIVDRSGWYKIICVGAGGNALNPNEAGDGYYNAYAVGGGSGGVTMKTKHINSNESISIVISNGVCECDGMVAGAGGNANRIYENGEYVISAGEGGFATGGDENFPGLNGELKFVRAGSNPNVGEIAVAESVSTGVYIPELFFEPRTVSVGAIGNTKMGFGVLGCGAGQGSYVQVTGDYETSKKLFPLDFDSRNKAICIIIPLEYTE